MHKTFFRGAVGAAIAAVCGTATAQPTLPPVTVTANPLGSREAVSPALVLSGPELLLRSQPTLGETLQGLPGVSSTYFGPAASRPVIRGLDGDRIRVLNNSGASNDLSALSYDHAVSADPISVERIEVLRGPGALLYGGNAIGGVVNLIDNRIPREPVPGVLGRADLGWSSGNRGRNGALLVEGGNERLGLHADVFRRKQGEVRVPLSLPCAQAGVTRDAHRLCNSTADTEGGAVGGSLFFDRGYLGASTSSFASDYGAASEDEVSIGMRNRQHALQGEVRDLAGWFTAVKGRLGHTAYRHTEFDAGTPGTEFRNRGTDLRLEARHAPIGPLQGVLGLQAEANRFSAEGDEAFAPHSRTRQQALFAYEEWATGWGKWTFGARAERVEVESLGNPGVARFAPARRSFQPRSAAAGVLWNLAPAWQLTGQLARSERAPRDYELFANGPHLATAAYEVGNPDLGKERSVHAEAGVQWKRGADLVRLGAFHARFSSYLALLGTGGMRDAEGNAGVTDCGDGTSVESGCAAAVLAEFAYRSIPARSSGLEANGNVRLLEGAAPVDLEWRADAVRATNPDNGQALPRIPPVRLGATLVHTRGPWSARVGFDHNARQDRVPLGEQATAACTLWNAALSYRMKAGPAQLLWYLRLDNAGNRLAYSATSILTQTAPGRVPLPGRSLRLGVQANF